MNKLKIYSFFSGCGFLDLGFETIGYQIELVNEYSSAFMDAYKYSRKKMQLPPPTFGYANIDINEFLTSRSDELKTYISKSRDDGSIVGFIGGPPCPDFSVAGKQKGRNGDNGKLSLSYINLILSQKPDFFLFENVKGLWRTAKHREFYEELKSMLIDAGYCLTDRLTNSLEFGVAQDRDRILLFGLNKSLVTNKDFNLVDSFDWNRYIKYCLSDIKSIAWPDAEPFSTDTDKLCPNNIPVELTVEYWFNRNDVTNHPNALDHFTPRSGIEKMLVVNEGDTSKKSYKRLHRWKYSPTVAYGNNEVHLHPYKARRLSVSEALSLQSLPKEFELPADMSLSDKFKTIGNGVPFLLSQGIAKTIEDFLNEGDYIR